jgi:hypothetical protein
MFEKVFKGFGGDDMVDMVDVFFNGSRERGQARNAAAEQAAQQVTIAELIKRGTSVVKSGGKLYRFTVTEVDLSKL